MRLMLVSGRVVSAFWLVAAAVVAPGLLDFSTLPFLFAALCYGVAPLLLPLSAGRMIPKADVLRLCAVFLLVQAGMREAVPVWSVPQHWRDIFVISETGSALLLLLVFCLESASRALRQRGLDSVETLAVLALPCLFNLLLCLGSPVLPKPVFAAQFVVLAAFNLAVAQLLSVLLRGKCSGDPSLLGWVALAALAGAMAPGIADLPWSCPQLADGVLMSVLVVLAASVLSQAVLWGQTYVVTGWLLDALEGRAPVSERTRGHWWQGATRGGVYGGLFMFLVQLLASGSTLLHFWILWSPLVIAAVLGAIAFPLLKTIVESFDGSAPFVQRFGSSLRDPLNYGRGAVLGLGVAWALWKGLPVWSSWERSAFGFVLGALVYAGVHGVRDSWRLMRGQRHYYQHGRVYLVEILLGGITGAALAWYAEAAQLQVIVEKFARYATVAVGAPEPYVVYPLFSKWGALNLGQESGGARLLFNESLSGVIAWSLAAPLFSINLVFLTALLQRSLRPLHEFATAEGVRQVVAQALRVERWGLWMAPIIYSFLRMAPDPEWYNQDGAIRTVIATVMSLSMDESSFRTWSLEVFIGLLALDWLRILIWFDHMGLRVATLVNLSFVGGDRLDEKAARFAGYPATTRIIPEGLRRFGTWMPLLLPFYIPRGTEWDVAWSQAEQLSQQQSPDSFPAIVGIAITFVLLGIVVAVCAVARGASSSLKYRGWSTRTYKLSNDHYTLVLDGQGRGFSCVQAGKSATEVIDLTRRPFSPLGSESKFFYARDEKGALWQLPSVPGRQSGDKAVVVQEGHRTLSYVSCHDNWWVETRVTIDESDPVERWQITLRNNSAESRTLRLASCRDPVLRPPGVVERHASYNDLHLRTVSVPTLQAVLVENRLLSHPPSLPGGCYFHAVGALPACAKWLGYQTHRAAFFGSGSRRHPEAVGQSAWSQQAEETFPFDPCVALAIELRLGPGESGAIVFAEGWAPDRQRAAQQIARHLHLPQPPVERLRCLPPPCRPEGAGIPLPWQFSEDGCELSVTTHTPQPWFHPLANANGYGAFANNEGSLYSFHANSQQNALTPFSFGVNAAELPGQAWYLYDCDSGQPVLRLPLRLECSPADPEHVGLTSVFGLGYVHYRAQRHRLVFDMEAFVFSDEAAEARIVTLRNEDMAPRRLRVAACFQWVLAELAEDSRGVIKTRWDAGEKTFVAENPAQQFCRGPAFMALTFAPDVAETGYHRFIGEQGTVSLPHMLRVGHADQAAPDTGYRVAAFSHEVILAPGASLQLGLVLGQASSAEEVRRRVAQSATLDHLQARSRQVRQMWRSRLGRVQVETEDPAFDRLVNYWLPYQLLAARLWGRHGPYQRSGAYGFRDQLQDAMPLAVLYPELCRHQILLHAAQQFPEGDVLQWWHTAPDGETGIGARNRASDVPLWLPHVAHHYAGVTGDSGIWDEPVYFIEGKRIPPGQAGIVFVPLRSREHASLYDHCRLAIDHVLSRRGEHGLPLIGTGDWNDGLDALGSQGKGESVWLGFFLYRVLGQFIEVAQAKQDPATAARFRSAAVEIQQALDAQWRERRFVRAISDEGCELVLDDALMSAWPVLSGAVSPERGREALQRGLEVLEQEHLVLLLHPPFGEGEGLWPGRIALYPPGVRENGSQYSHGCSWLVDAALQVARDLEREGDVASAARWRSRAASLWKKISPLTHAEAGHWFRYGLEPHQQPADVYAGPGYEGRGGWSWYTGSAARMLSSAWNLLELQFQDGQLPSPPSSPRIAPPFGG